MALGGISFVLITLALSILFCGITESHHLDLLKHRPKSNNIQTENGNPSTNTNVNLQNGGNTQQKPRLKAVSQWSQSETKEKSFTQIGGKQGRKEITQESKQVNEHFKLMSSSGNRNKGNQMRMSVPRSNNNIQQTGTQQPQNSQSRFGQNSQLRSSFGNFLPQQRQRSLPKQSQSGLNTITSNSNQMNTQLFGTQLNQVNAQNQPKFGFNAIVPGSNRMSTQPIKSLTNQMASQNSNRQQQFNQGQFLRGNNVLMPQQGQNNLLMRGSQIVPGNQPVQNQHMTQNAQNLQPISNQIVSQQQQQKTGPAIASGQQTQHLVSQMLAQLGPSGNKQPMLGPPSGQQTSAPAMLAQSSPMTQQTTGIKQSVFGQLSGQQTSGPAMSPEKQTQQLVSQMLAQSSPIAQQTTGSKQSMLGQPLGQPASVAAMPPEQQTQQLVSQMLAQSSPLEQKITGSKQPTFGQPGSGPVITPEQQTQQLLSTLLGQSGPVAQQPTGNQQSMLGLPSGPFIPKQQLNPSSGLISPNQLLSSLNQLSKEQLVELSQILGLPQSNTLNANQNVQNTNLAQSTQQNSFTGQKANKKISINVQQKNQNNPNIRQKMIGKINPPKNNMNLGTTRQNILGKINPNIGNARQNMLGKMNTQQKRLNSLNLGNIFGKISPNLNNQKKPTANATDSGKSKNKEPQTAQIRVSIKRKTKVTPSKKEKPIRYIIPGNMKSTQSSSGILGSALSGQNFQQQTGSSVMNSVTSLSSPMFSNQQSQGFNTENNNRFPIVKLPIPDVTSMLTGESPSFKPNMLLAEALDSLPLDVLRGTPNDPLLASLTAATGGTSQTNVNGNTAVSNNIKIITKPGSNTSTGTSASGSPGTQEKMSLTLMPSHPGARPIVIKSAGNVLVSQYKDAKGQTQYIIKTQTKTTTTLGPSAEEAGEYEAEEMTSTTQSTTGSVAG